MATPGRIVAHLDAGNVVLKDSLQTLVIDEADLVLSFGFDEDVRRIVSQIPNVVQTLLMSATLNADVEQLKQLVLKKAAILRLEEGSDEQTLTQFYVMYVPLLLGFPFTNFLFAERAMKRNICCSTLSSG